MHTIRYADSNDAKILGEIHSASWREAYKGIIPDEILNSFTPERRESYFQRALSEGWEEDAIIFNGNQALGLICIGKSRDPDLTADYGEIWGIYLLPEYWNQGIGSTLIDWGIDELKKRGYSRVSLWVLEENMHACSFYERKGFRHDGAKKDIRIGAELTEVRYISLIPSY